MAALVVAMTRDEFDQTCKDVCPHCNKGEKLRQREDTAEWVHDVYVARGQGHAFCLASHFRNKWARQLSGG
jgi:hypothetical protein